MPTPSPNLATSSTIPPPPAPAAWSFTYDGPIQAVDDRSCDLCNAIGAKKCPKDASRHGSNPDACSTCLAVRIGYCNNHCGIERAIREHDDDSDHIIDEDHQPTFDLAMKAILAYVDTMPKDVSHVIVKAFAHQDQPDAPFAALHLDVTVRK